MHSRKPIEPLSKKQFDEAIAKGVNQKLTVGNGLYLHVRDGSSLWIIQFRDGASHRARSLGTYPEVSLNAARRAREDFAVERRRSRVPRRGLAVINSAEPASEPKTVPATVKRMRFADVVEGFLLNAPAVAGWKTKTKEPPKYRKLKDGALGKLWADEITTADVEAELRKRWGHALASADKYRMRIKAVCDYARAKGFRDRDAVNPANNDDLKNLIAKPPKSVPHPSMPVAEVPAFMRELAADGSNEARALAFLIHTVARTSEARDVDWREIKGNVWTIPGGLDDRSMKEGEEHSVPLSPAALALLGKPKKSGRIFGQLPHDALDDKLKEYRELGTATVHGFRASFNDWAENAGYPKSLWGRALAHAVGDTTERAYNRAKRIEERRPMMVAWSDFINTG
jgi:integrase